MRLNPEQIKRLTEVIHDHVPAGSLHDVRLFGSRLDDHLRGGDVDLYIEVKGLDATAAGALQRRLRPLLEEAIDLPVDLVVHRHGEPLSLVARIVTEEGLSLENEGRC